MVHSFEPSTMPRLIELILRRTIASISSPCSLYCATISRACRSASGKFAISASPSSRSFASDSRARNRTRASVSFMKTSEREVFLLGQALANQIAQPRDVEPRIAPRFRLRHLVGFFVDLRFGLEIRRHQLDYASDQFFDVAFGFDNAAIDQPIHEMRRQRVDLSLPHRHGSQLDRIACVLSKASGAKSRGRIDAGMPPL